MIKRGNYVEIKPIASRLIQSYPAGKWVKKNQIVQLIDDAPNSSTLDVLDVKTLSGDDESIYDFQIVKKAKRPNVGVSESTLSLKKVVEEMIRTEVRRQITEDKSPTNLSRLRIEQSDNNDDDYESQYWSAPDKIRNMIDAVSMRIERGGKDSYKALSDLNRVLNRHGWEIDYGLDGEIHTLRKI